MWLRTAMNYQYRHGGGLSNALRTLHAQGGLGRFYQGLSFALLQTPLSRFGDTAANVGVLALFAALMPNVSLGIRTACASAAGAMWRMAITPLDTFKTSLQVEGPAAYHLLLRKARVDGPFTLWAGALGNAAANFVGSYPWFLTFNMLDESLPRPERAQARVTTTCNHDRAVTTTAPNHVHCNHTPLTHVTTPLSQVAYRLLRSACMGCIATGVSDVASNSIRVVKTTTQTSPTQIGYLEAARLVVAADGFRGLICRGLGTRLLANALQSALFAVIWKLIEAEMNGS